MNHDLVLNPVADYINGDIEPDWDEVFYRNYKGITMSAADDFAISASTITQVLGEDMVNDLFRPNNTNILGQIAIIWRVLAGYFTY